MTGGRRSRRLTYSARRRELEVQLRRALRADERAARILAQRAPDPEPDELELQRLWGYL